MVAMTPLVGPVADGLVKKGWELTTVRKLAQVTTCHCAIHHLLSSILLCGRPAGKIIFGTARLVLAAFPGTLVR